MDNSLNISSAQYSVDPVTGETASVVIVVDGVSMSVPLDPANRHYAEILRQVEAGTLTIEDAD
tara:strand:- start:2557 stop:2745 length:189 start_codon:yes stop_codon:yes gene_type:complete